MATRLTMTSRVREYINELDSTNSHFTDVQIYSFLNQAIRVMGTDLEWPIQTAQATSVAEQAIYTLPENFISLSDVYFDSSGIEVIDRGDLKAINYNWQQAVSGKPLYVYKSDNRKFGLYPKPDTEHADLLIQIQYIKIPIDIDSDTAVPDLHFAFQDCLPFYAAYLCQKILGNSKAMGENMSDYNTHKKLLTSKLQRFSDELYRFRWTLR